MRLRKEDFEILKVIGRGAFGEVFIVLVSFGTFNFFRFHKSPFALFIELVYLFTNKHRYVAE